MGAIEFELDHLFVCTDVGAPEADRLVALGLTEGEANVHPGQGTANRRFFFRNAFLELLWVSDLAEVQSELVQATQLWPRWLDRSSGGSPFGVCLRPVRPGFQGIPFPSWEYRPPYLPSSLVIHVREGVPFSEPWWGYLGFGRRPDSPDWPRPQPLQHRIGFREITHVQLTAPSVDSPSTVGSIALSVGPEHLAEITFDGGTQGSSEDFRPGLPLVFRW